MEENKILITCPECGRQMRIPSDKHIKFSCPQCNLEHEYKNGVKYTPLRKRWRVPVLIILLSVVAVSLWGIFRNSDDDYQVKFYGEIKNQDTPSTTPVLDTIPAQYEPPSKDKTEQLLSELEQEILEEGLDILKDIVESILDDINEEADNGSWEKANEWYERASETMRKGGKKGEKLLEIYEGRLAKTKTNILSKNPNPNKLPDSELLADNKKEGAYATDYVKNNTRYVLTLFYSGPTAKRVIFQPGEKKSVSLLKGFYSIVAKVSAPGISEYYRTQLYQGYSYSGVYSLGF